MTEESQQHPQLTPQDLDRLSAFLVTAILELSAGLQEVSAELSSPESTADEKEDQSTRYIQVLAGIAGTAAAAAMLAGVDRQTLSSLSQEIATRVMTEFDKVRQTTH